MAKTITDAYGIRSSLVHGGRRHVSLYDAYDAQKLAEDLYFTILKYVDLSTTKEQFESDLKKASYGLTWPIKK